MKEDAQGACTAAAPSDGLKVDGAGLHHTAISSTACRTTSDHRASTTSRARSLIMGIRAWPYPAVPAHAARHNFEPSYALRASGRSDELAHSSLRMTIRPIRPRKKSTTRSRAIKHNVARAPRTGSPLWEMFRDGIDISTIQWSSSLKIQEVTPWLTHPRSVTTTKIHRNVGSFLKGALADGLRWAAAHGRRSSAAATSWKLPESKVNPETGVI